MESDGSYCFSSDEFDNYNSFNESEDEMDVCDDEIDGISNLRPEEQKFTILREEDIRLLQENEVANTEAVLGVSSEEALILLINHKWRMDDVHDKWFADQERVRKAVGLLENPVVKFNSDKSFAAVSKQFLCKICMEIFPMNESISVSCGHPFCEECWRAYIRTSVNDGVGCLMLKCPEPSCGAAVGQVTVNRVVSEEDKVKYLSYLVRSYVEANRKIKWCPAPGCDCAVEFVFGNETYDVACSCSYRFCWNCTEAIHRPVNCDTVSKWMMKNKSEFESVIWMLGNLKPCPNCRRPIEKYQGCMHMTCKMCNYEFCWLCLGNWRTHGTGPDEFYSCNRYEQQKKNGNLDENEIIKQLAKKSLDNKYMHYFERWESNQSAMKKTEMELEQMKDANLEMLRVKYCQPQSQIVFILEALEQIIECRRVLKWTYAYGYYISDEEETKKQFFEYLQGEAEAALEKLHHCIENEMLLADTTGKLDEESSMMHLDMMENFQRFRTKLMDLTKVTKNYFENFVKALENGLADLY